MVMRAILLMKPWWAGISFGWAQALQVGVRLWTSLEWNFNNDWANGQKTKHFNFLFGQLIDKNNA